MHTSNDGQQGTRPDQVADALNDAACAGLHINVRALQQGHQGSGAVAFEQPAHIGPLKAQIEDDIGALCCHLVAGAVQMPHYGSHIAFCGLLSIGWLPREYSQHLHSPWKSSTNRRAIMGASQIWT